MGPIVVRSWTTHGYRISVVWRVFGVPVFGRVFLPWEVPIHFWMKDGHECKVTRSGHE